MLALPTFLALLLPLTLPVTEPLHYGLFGDLHIARPHAAAEGAVVFFSDQDGWTAHEDAYAAALAADGQLVLGVDLPAYLKELASIDDACSRPEAHVQEVVHWVERHEQFADYRAPLMMGLGSGASFAYATTAQAPAGAFVGLVSVGWRFGLRLPKPLCAGDAGEVSRAVAGGAEVIPLTRFPVPWTPRPFLDPAAFDGVAAARSTLLARAAEAWRLAVGSGRAPAQQLVADLRRRSAHADPLPADVADLPLTEIAPSGTPSSTIALVVTGDGGWAGLDKGIAEVLSTQGLRVVGFSSLSYFWKTRKPEEAADAIARVIGHYAQAQPDARFVLIGYSFGASLAPVVINRLPPAARQKLAAQFLISPDSEAVFEVKVGDWFGSAHHEGTLPIAPEVARSPVPVFCIHGQDEDDSVCPQLDPAKTTVLSLPGGHHYDGDYAALGRLVARHIPH